MDNKYLKLPFTRYDTPYLESLPDEVFFACRFIMSDEDTAFLLKNSTEINGRRFYKARIRKPLLEKYAALTNPKEGEPGSKSKPLIRFGKGYVYNNRGSLIPFELQPDSVMTANIKPIAEQNSSYPWIVAEHAGFGVPDARFCAKKGHRHRSRYGGWQRTLISRNEIERRTFRVGFERPEAFMHISYVKA